MYRSRGQRRTGPMLTMAPSSIHHINSDTVDIISPELDKSIIEVSKNALKAGELLKIQAVQKDGQWFALNSAQLDLCRRLENEGSCQVVLVDPVPATEVPEDVRRMMKVPSNTGYNSSRKTTAGTGTMSTGITEPETDNTTTRDVPDGRSGTTTGGGKGYRMLGQADPLDMKDRQGNWSMPEGSGVAQDDENIDRQTVADVEENHKVEATDDSSDDDSSDSECDWSEEGDDSGSEDDHARLADTSDEMSCLL